ncbi:MAG: tRNA adenosine(34) deaminase TadA [Gemmatimonadetes bacterium]|nr:tRNA adenosine(34) deaminase TadA [Gemmatimonadota bacterium]
MPAIELSALRSDSPSGYSSGSPSDSPSDRPSGPPSDEASADVSWMSRALDLARAAATRGEVPVGAVIVRAGQVLGEGHNRTITDADPTAHAEVVAIRQAAAELGDWRLIDCTLYVTIEPCSMCAGAIVLSRIPRVVYGARDPKAGMVDSLGNLLRDVRLNHRCEVTEGVLATESSELLRSFFRERR